MANLDIRSLLEDYMAHKDERDGEFQFQQTAGSLIDNIKEEHQGPISAQDVAALENEINSLMYASSDKNWKGKQFGDIMNDVLAIQQEKNLRLQEVIDLVASIKWNPQAALGADAGGSKEKWIELVFNDFNVTLQNVEALTREIDPYPLHVLDKVFVNIQSFDEQSVFEYFKALNEAEFNYDLKLELLNVLAKTHDSFEEGKLPLYYMKCQQLLKRKGFNDDDIADLFTHFDRLLENGWTIVDFFNSIDTVLKNCATGEEFLAIKNLKESFKTAADYRMKGNDLIVAINKTSAENPSGNNFSGLNKNFNDSTLLNFGKSHVKGLEELLSEIASLNGWSEDQTSALRQDHQNVMEAFKSSSNLIGKEVDSCNYDDIKRWVESFSGSENQPPRAEKVAFVKKAFELFKGYTIRDIQLLSLLYLYKPEAGTLAQINTGEGKTAIIAMLATLFCLEGKKVDIVTSSPELAGPQAEELKEFYDKFNVSSACLEVESSTDWSDKKKEIYKSQVLYGSVTEYEADILRDEYGKSGVRSKRPFDIALVDEVDSMLIDGKNFSVRLSSPMPGMSELLPILGAIWIHLGIVATRIREQDGKVFYVEDPNKPESDFELNMSKFDFLKKNVEDHVRLLLRDRERLSDENRSIVADYPEMEIPVYVKDFVFENRIQKWVANAIYAKFYNENGRDYVIEDNKIKIVDKSTGVIHGDMSYSDGAHQFLQMKHGSKISAESMTTNFISNASFFKRYGKNIYGLSGTLGSSVAQEFLRETYEVKLIVVPPFKMKLHIALEPTICASSQNWLDAVASSSIAKLQANRSCLVIAESINDAENIAKSFRDKNYEETKILMYTTDKAKAVINKKISSGEVIISTNLSGRGTDIKLTDEVNANGGLHLCLTFLPDNDRIELQNLGRTSRTGNPGTSQFVLLDPSLTSLQTQQARRDAANVELFKNAAIGMKRTSMRAKVFEKFCVFLDVIKGPNESNALSDWGEINRNGCSVKAVAEATEERFGFWLKANEDTNPDEYLQKFEQFEREIKADAGAGNLVRNPFYYVRSGKEFLDKKEYNKAEDQFTKGIDMDLKFAANGYYNRAFTMIEKYGETEQTSKIDDAIKDLRSARAILEKRKTDLLIIQQACRDSDSSELADQVIQKANLLDIQISAINRAVGYDNDSLRTQIEEMRKNRGDMEDQIKNFVPRENLKANFDQVEIMYKTLQERYTGGNGEIDKVKARRDELENKVLSFQTEEKLRENISNIDSAIEDAEKKMQRQGVLIEARGKNRSVKISHVKLDDILNADVKAYEDDIAEVESNGYLGSFEVSERPPVDWSAVIGVFLIGLAQMVAGAAIAIFSFGAASSIGIGMLMEGVSDVVTAVRDGIINRNFDWKNWAIMKAISYTVSIAVAGLGALKNIVSAAYSAVKGVVKGAATVFSETVKEGWKLAGKKVGIELSNGVATELVVGVINYGLDATLMVEIEKRILEGVRPKIQRGLLDNANVKKLLLVDELSKNHNFENTIKEMAIDILQSPEVESSLEIYATGVADGVASQKSRGIGNAIEIVKSIAALEEALNFVDAFMSVLLGKLDKTAADEEVDKVIATLGRDKVSTQETNQNIKNELIEGSPNRFEGDVDLSKGRDQEIVKSQYKKSDQSHLVDTIANLTTKSISSIVKGQIIAPATYALSSFGANRLSASLDAALRKHVDLYQSKRRLIQVANNDRGGLLDKSFKQNHQKTENVRKVDSLIQDVKSGNELGLVHMGALTEAVGRPIQVLDNKGKVVFTVGKAQKGQKPLQAQFHPPTESRPQGHWTLPNGQEAPNVGSGINDCLLNVVCAQVPGRPYELRNKLAQNMEAKKDWLANAMPDYLKLQRQLKSGLFEGGAKFDPENDVIKDLIVFSNDNYSHSTKRKNKIHGAKGHPKGHIPFTNGGEDSVQNYSFDGVKTSLSTAEETYTVMKTLLSSQVAKDMITKLNKREKNSKTGELDLPPDMVAVKFTAEQLTETDKKREVLHYSHGEVVHRSTLQGYTIILRHRQGQNLNANAKLFIQTAFPHGELLPQEIFNRERDRSSSANRGGSRGRGRENSVPRGPRPPGRDSSAGSPAPGSSHVPRPPGRDPSAGSPAPGSSHVPRPPGRGNSNNRLGRGGTSPSPLGRGSSNTPSGGGGPTPRPRGNSGSRPWGNSRGSSRGNSGGRGQDSPRPPPP